MNKLGNAFAIFILVGALACGGETSQSADAGVPGSLGEGAAPGSSGSGVGSDGSMGGADARALVVPDDAGMDGDGATADARPAGDVAVSPMEPNVSAAFVKFPIAGSVALVGKGTDSCSNQEPAPGDRWCAFSRSVALGREELWVINVTALSKGVEMECVPDNSYCKRLTANLWSGTPSVGPSHPYAHAFAGDTLIFHANALSASTELHQGPIYAWRPTWDGPRQISTNKGITCAGHFAGEVALCLDSIEPDEAKPLEFDLLAGRLADAGAQGLPRMDRIVASRSNDVSKWRANFSRDGSQFCYSTGRTPTDAENLWCFPSSALAANAVASGTRKTAPLLTDTARWAFARDTQKIYFLRGFNYSDFGTPSGTLQMVDYPSGQNATMIGTNVGAFMVLSDGSNTDRGLGLFTNVAQNKGTFGLVRDRNAPGDFVVIGNGVATASLSADLRYTYVSLNVNEQTGLTDAYVARNSTATKTTPAARCTLQSFTSTDSYGSPFLNKGGLVFWAEDIDPNLLIGKGMVANPEDCSSKMSFGKDVDFWFPVDDRGLVWSDDTDIDVVSIRYAQVPDGKTWPGAAGHMLVQKQAARIYAMTAPAHDLLVFQLDSRATQTRGIYVAKLPF